MLSANNHCDIRHMMSHCLNCNDNDAAQNQSNIGHHRLTQPIVEYLLVVGFEFVGWVLHRHYDSPYGVPLHVSQAVRLAGSKLQANFVEIFSHQPCAGSVRSSSHSGMNAALRRTAGLGQERRYRALMVQVRRRY
jgi:hypothetical protein